MKYFTTGAKSALIDKISIEEVGMPQMVLMERASLGVAGAAAEFIKDKKQKILTVVEGGNNGGDGVAAARILKARLIDRLPAQMTVLRHGLPTKSLTIHDEFHLCTIRVCPHFDLLALVAF